MKTLTIVCALALCACGASANAPQSDDPDDIGKLSVGWTFDERTDASVCSTSNLKSVEIDVTAEDGSTVGTTTKPCTALTAMMVLPPGRYMATARCVDSTGAPRSTPIQTAQFTIEGSVSVKQAIDFPGSALYPVGPLD